MPLNLASPGIVVREVDLTIGRVDATSASIGAIVAPFAQGPVDSPYLVNSEADLLKIFGNHTRPISTMSIGSLLHHFLHMVDHWKS